MFTQGIDKNEFMSETSAARITKFFRIATCALVERTEGGITRITGPDDFVAALKPGYGVVAASWDQCSQLGVASRLGVVLHRDATGAAVRWVPVDLRYRPSSTGRRFWAQAKPFFAFAPDVAARYLLAATFAEYFPDLELPGAGTRQPQTTVPRPSASPTGGYVYLVRSAFGVKIGKSVNVKSRTRLFEVKLPFPITVEHFAWFEDYSLAEREFHRQYHAKRLEGEWFDLSASDIDAIKAQGTPVPLLR